MKDILAVILARGGSKRIPHKNLKEIDGIPLVGHAINHAKTSKYINRILVSTDDAEIRRVSNEYGAETIERPEEFRNDNTIMEADNILCQVVEDLESKGDKVDISSHARELQKAQEAVRQMPEVDLEKVEKIKAQLKNGTYKVAPDKIATKILEESLLNSKG